ncbi:hypothetical protein [Deinococcus pimensis]|uniref:hypothetical protein n=1 Tax=Deinococcus pimensis TaxID=309888 RepID=UPI0004B6A3A5|nr:hypothetical protein [Deinococcus pimensis]
MTTTKVSPLAANRAGAERLARGLGWFSIGLGLLEVLAPRWLGRRLGMEDRVGLLRAYGARELMAGAGILSRERPTGWVWARVGGDALDIATLGAKVRQGGPGRRGALVALGMVLGVTALDVLCGARLRK